MPRSRIPLALAALFALTACSGPEVDKTSGGVAAVGTSARPSGPVAAALAASLEHERGGALPDGVVPRRVGRLARDLAQASGTRLSSVTLTASTQAALLVLPDGHLQLAQGALELLAATKAQPHLAALIAHAVAHRSLGHVEAGLVRALRARGVEALPPKVSPFLDGSASPRAAEAIGSALQHQRAARFDAAACAAADRLAVQSLARLGYAAPTLVDMWRHLAAAEARTPARVSQLVRAHGPIGARVSAAKRAAQALGRQPARKRSTLVLDLSAFARAGASQSVAEAAERLALRGYAQAAEQVLATGSGAADAPAGGRARARIHAARGEARATERTLRALLLRRPIDHVARLLLAQHYLQQSNRTAAREELEALLKRAPFLAEAHLLLGRVEDDPARARRRFVIARGLAVSGPVARAAETKLGPPRSGVAAPGRKDPKRTRILSGG